MFVFIVAILLFKTMCKMSIFGNSATLCSKQRPVSSIRRARPTLPSDSSSAECAMHFSKDMSTLKPICGFLRGLIICWIKWDYDIIHSVTVHYTRSSSKKWQFLYYQRFGYMPFNIIFLAYKQFSCTQCQVFFGMS